jgi:ribosomal protein L6P/L9E
MADVFAYEATVGPSNSGGTFGVLDLNTGVFTPRGQMQNTVVGLGTYGGLLYGAQYPYVSDDDLVFTIDPLNGSQTIAGPLGSHPISYGSFGSTAGGLFATVGSGLYGFNTLTFTGGVIGPTQTGVLSSGGTALYVGSGSELYSLNTGDGHATFIGNTGIPGGISALVVVGGVLYAVSDEATTNSPINNIYTLNVTTGAATFIATTSTTPAGLTPDLIDTTPAAPSDTAVVNGYVNAAHDTADQVLTGTAENNSTVTVYDNNVQVGTATADAATGAWSFPIGVLADASTHSYTVTATDAAGNVSKPSGALIFAVDTTAPTVAVSIDNADVNVANGTGTVTFSFSEAPTSFALADTSAVGGTLSNLQRSDTTHYTATFTGAANTDIRNASVSVTAGSYQDLAGNAGGSTMFSVKFSSAVATFYEVQNNWAPSQMIDGIFTGPPPSPGQDATYGGVNGWSVFDFATGMADGADALLTFATPLFAGQYNLTFRIYQNYYGNPGHILGDFALDYTTAASPTLSSPQTPVSIQSESSLNGTTFSVLSPGELLAHTSHNSIGTDTYTISALVDSAAPITGIFLDAIKNPALPGGGPGGQYGNGNFVVSEFTLDASTGGSTAPFTVDTVTPTVAVSIDNTDVNVANPTGLVTFVFSEAPVSFVLGDTSAVGGRLTNLQQVNSTTYIATFTAAANSDIDNASVSVTAGSWQEGNGNAGGGGSTAAFTVDTVMPTVAVSINSTTLNLVHNTAIVTFTFSEVPVSFVLADTSAVGGTLSNLQRSDTTHYTATFTAAANTLINNASVSVTAGSWQEGNGNPGTAGTTGKFIVDTMDHWINVSGGKWTAAFSWSNGVPNANVEAAVTRSTLRVRIPLTRCS